MPVYVDPNFEWPKTKAWPFGSVSHMYADTDEELHALAVKIGLKRVWCSDHTQPDSTLVHYDLSPAKRKQAIANGAIPVDHEHGEPYRVRNVWCYPAFVKHYTERAGGDPADLHPDNYDSWRRLWRFFVGGAVAGVNAERARLAKKESANAAGRPDRQLPKDPGHPLHR